MLMSIQNYIYNKFFLEMFKLKIMYTIYTLCIKKLLCCNYTTLRVCTIINSSSPYKFKMTIN